MLVKFAPTNILTELKENKKNCLVIVGKEPIQICTIKDDINKSCQKNSIDKIPIKVENGIDLNQLDYTFNNQSLFSSQIIYEFEVSDGVIKKEIKEYILKKIGEHIDSYFIFYFNTTKSDNPKLKIANNRPNKRGGEYELYSNGLIYSAPTINKLGKIVDSLNLKYKKCEF